MEVNQSNISMPNLLKWFNQPETKELGVLHGEIATNHPYIGYETEGEIYEVNIIDLPNILTNRQNSLPKGKGFVVVREDLKKLLKMNVGAVEVVITDDKRLLVIIHHFYEKLK